MGRELPRATPWFDHAVSGEADAVFPAFLAAVSNGTDPSTHPGRSDPSGRRGRRRACRAGHATWTICPTPDFDEFFERSERSGVAGPDAALRDTPLPFESSRGCWWGEKQHCTFCGLNGGTMKHRAKSPERVLAEAQRAHPPLPLLRPARDRQHHGRAVLRRAAPGVRRQRDRLRPLLRDQGQPRPPPHRAAREVRRAVGAAGHRVAQLERVAPHGQGHQGRHQRQHVAVGDPSTT